MKFQEVIIAREGVECERLYTVVVNTSKDRLEAFLYDIARGRTVETSTREFMQEVRRRLDDYENPHSGGWISSDCREGLQPANRPGQECVGAFVLNVTRTNRVQVWEAIPMPKPEPAVSTFRVVVTKTHTERQPSPVCRPNFRDAVGRGLREVYAADPDLSFTYEITEE